MYRKCIVEQDDGCLLDIRVQPRASSNRIVGMYAGRLKIAVMAPPLDGRANNLVVEFLAAKFKLSKKSIELLSGEKSRDKRVFIKGLNSLEILELLD